MKAAATVLQTLVRIIGPILIILGVLFWTGNATNLVPLHMLLGITLVLLLWALAILGAVAGVNAGLVALALVWGMIVPILGLTQSQLVPGPLHWVIQTVHLLVGLGAIGLAESLGRIIKRRRFQRSRERKASKLEGVVQ